MQRIRIAAKPRDTEGSVSVKLAQAPRLLVKDRVLTGFSGTEYTDKENREAPVMTVNIPETVEIIDHGAFDSWMALRHVNFGKKCYQMGSYVFHNCQYLETAILPEGLDRILLGTFLDCGNLRTVKIPSTVRRINMNSFKNCTSLKTLDFPPGLEAIENTAFWGCRSLIKIRLPDSLKEIGDYAFGSCTGLKAVELPSNLESVGVGAFQNCIELEEIVIPEGVRVLPGAVFAGCRNLRRVKLPESLERISPFAFYGCENLTFLEHSDIGKFEKALKATPFRLGRCCDYTGQTRLPMALIHAFSGGFSGYVLSAMGYPWFDIDKHYSIFTTGCAGLYEVHSRYPDEVHPKQYYNDYILMDDCLEPVPGVSALLRFSDASIRYAGSYWKMQQDAAMRTIQGRKEG